MKFVFSIEKKNAANVGTVKGHNNRLHPTASQLPKEAWFTKPGCHSYAAFNQVLLDKAKSLSKRKDAVLAVELVIQVGNQTDWRELPTSEHPYGQKKSGYAEKLNLLMKGVKAAAFAEFGEGRIISIDLHTDESTPHAHVVFAPIFEGKLQAKHWLDGTATCAVLREKIHGHVTKFIECDYEKGAPGGAPHDPSKAAGQIKGPQPKAKRQTLIEKASEALSNITDVKPLKEMISALNQKIQTLFSRLKSAEKKAAATEKLRLEAVEKAKAAVLSEQKARREIVLLERKIVALTPKPVVLTEKPIAEESKVTNRASFARLKR